MGDHDDQPVLGDLLQQLHDLHGGFGVQSAGGFVSQQDLGIVDQRPGDGHTLHLTAGHLIGLLVQLVAQAHLFQRFDGSAAALGFLDAGEGQGQFHVGQDTLVGDQVIALEHKADGVVAVGVPVTGLVILGGFTPDDQVTGGIAVQTADDVQQGGLAAAGLTQHSHELRRTELDADTLQGVNSAGGYRVLFGDIG